MVIAKEHFPKHDSIKFKRDYASKVRSQAPENRNLELHLKNTDSPSDNIYSPYSYTPYHPYPYDPNRFLHPNRLLPGVNFNVEGSYPPNSMYPQNPSYPQTIPQYPLPAMHGPCYSPAMPQSPTFPQPQMWPPLPNHSFMTPTMPQLCQPTPYQRPAGEYDLDPTCCYPWNSGPQYQYPC